ncbi:transcription factor E2F8 [Notechis scutatus]|uniref:Transcription factor E2F8 n=1 Tax=Notechis scutatus TaxID=8663 RepID=A0A6J1TRC9_9SAUR|nr:transcription factor E2F8 [Notechis scutatus]XP_026520536.1 transcription factor E2F8 [Notechis scutatus]
MNKENKENQCFGVRGSPVKNPLRQTVTPNWLLTEIQPAVSDHLTTPPKSNESTSGDPWTPTANLKMLISAASPEIRNREQEKKWSDNKSESLEDHLSGDEYEKPQTSRKEKSLGLLCHKFLARYPNYPNFSKNNEICLDEVAEDLNIERRRIYDIMNVLESLHMVSRFAKNRYSWHGRHNLKKTLQALKKVAEENKDLQQTKLTKKRKNGQEIGNTGQNIKWMTTHAKSNYHTDFVELPGMELQGASVNSRKDTSLRVMSQKFVMLFLGSYPQVVSLDVAAKSLIGEDHCESVDKSKFKTKIRRLYDIANVLGSLELIKKVHIMEEKGRRPAFKWIGPNVFSDIKDTKPELDVMPLPVEGKPFKECSKNLFPTNSKPNFTRHPSLMKLARSKENDQRKSHSAPGSPVKKYLGSNPSTIPNKMAQLAAICKQQLDEQSREFEKMKKKLEHTSPSESCWKPKAVLLPSQAANLSPTSNSTLPTVPCAAYLNPSQVVTTCPNYMVYPVSTTHVTKIKTPVEALTETFTKDSFNDWEKVEELQLWLTKEPSGTTDDMISGKCFKRSKLEGSPIKKCKSKKMELQNSLLDIKVPNEVAVSSKGKTELCAVGKKSYSSPNLGLIPVTSNFPTFHITPLNLIPPPPSVATTSSGNGAVESAHLNPTPPQSTLVLNIMLQQLGMRPADVQMSADHVHRSAFICQGAEHVSPVPVSVGLQQATVLLRDYRDLHGELIPTTPQETSVPVTFKNSKKGNETSSDPSLYPGSH